MKKGKGKRESIILRVVLVAFSVYVIFSLSSSWSELTSSLTEEEMLNNQKAELEASIDGYNQLLQSSNEKDFIERAAREKLGYVFPDELVFVDISGN